jgi:type VI protein secretion system component VasK
VSQAHQAASSARDKALETVRQLAQEFQPLGTDGIDAVVRDLLEQPIRGASAYIVTNPDKAAEGKLNGQLAVLCAVMRPVLAKYPLSRGSSIDASLAELASLFAPQTGAVWKYHQESLAEFVVREGSRWVQKADVPKPRVSQAVLDMLNRSQQISNALYGAGAGQLSLHYTMRPVSGSLPDQNSLEFNFDGRVTTFSKGNAFQRSFTWPPSAGSGHRAQAKVVMPTFSAPFASGAGIWGVFRIFADAEPRALNEPNVEWKYSRVAGGEMAPMDPPVRMQFVEFPGGVDLFNPHFFGSLGCPSKAVQ